MPRLKNLGARLGGLKRRMSEQKRADPFYDSRHWRAFAAMIRKARGDRCEEEGCETPTDRVAADHIIERRDGGAEFDATNIRLRCHRHHMKKTAQNRRTRGG